MAQYIRFRLFTANNMLFSGREGSYRMNGIFVQTEYHGKLISKIVCGRDVRWFITGNCAVTYATLSECMAAIDRRAALA